MELKKNSIYTIEITDMGNEEKASAISLFLM